MTTTGLNLLISDKADPERDALADAFSRRGGEAHRLGRFWDPPTFDPASVRVYGADPFCLVLQQKLGFPLCSPADDLLLQVPPAFLQRRLEQQTLLEAQSGSFPMFIKPLVPKQFRGAVYQSANDLAKECHGLPSDTKVFSAEPVKFTAEVRSFVLKNRVLDAALYEGQANITGAVEFIAALFKKITVPMAVVIDVGLIANRGWGVIEFNAAWGAGLNGCDPEKVLPAILAASGGKERRELRPECKSPSPKV
jgi:hypothetical protein